MNIEPPPALTQSIVVGGLYWPLYRIFMLAIAVAVGVILWLMMEKTRMGATARATVYNPEMARGVGNRYVADFAFIFALGAFGAGASSAFTPGWISKLLRWDLPL